MLDNLKTYLGTLDSPECAAAQKASDLIAQAEEDFAGLQSFYSSIKELLDTDVNIIFTLFYNPDNGSPDFEPFGFQIPTPQVLYNDLSAFFATLNDPAGDTLARSMAAGVIQQLIAIPQAINNGDFIGAPARRRPR